MNATSLVRSGCVDWKLATDDESWLVSIRDELFVVHDAQVAAQLADGALVEYQFEEVGRQKVMTSARSLEPRKLAPKPLPDGPVTGASLLAAAMLVAPMDLAPTEAVETVARLARKLGAVGAGRVGP